MRIIISEEDLKNIIVDHLKKKVQVDIDFVQFEQVDQIEDEEEAE